MRPRHTVAIAAGSALVAALAASTLTYAATHTPPARHAHTVTHTAPSVCDDLAQNVLDMADVMLTAWESNTPYQPEFRADNIDTYAAILPQCEAAK